MSDFFNISTSPLRAIWYGVTLVASSLWSLANKISSFANGIFFRKPADKPGSDQPTETNLAERQISHLQRGKQEETSTPPPLELQVQIELQVQKQDTEDGTPPTATPDSPPIPVSLLLTPASTERILAKEGEDSGFEDAKETPTDSDGADETSPDSRPSTPAISLDLNGELRKERRPSTSSKESDSSGEGQLVVYQDALTTRVPWRFTDFESSQDLKSDFTRELLKHIGEEKANVVKDALFNKVEEITKIDGLFENQVLQYRKLIGNNFIAWGDMVEDVYEIVFKGSYIVISRSFAYSNSSVPVTGKWMLPIDESIDPTPSFSVDHIHDWRYRKFLVTFHQLWKATVSNVELDTYKKSLLQGSKDHPLSLGGRLYDIVRLINEGKTGQNEQVVFDIWKQLEQVLRDAATLAKATDPSTLQFRLFDAFILALYENPQLEFFQSLHASLLENQGEQPNCGIKALFEAHEKNKGTLKTDAKTVNDKKSLDDVAGYCNLLNIGRFPYPLTVFGILGKKLSLYSMGTPTVEERPIVEKELFGIHLYNRPSLVEVTCTVNPIFQHWVEATKRAGKAYAYANLQPLVMDTSSVFKQVEKLAADNFGTKNETRRAKALKEWLGKAFAAYPTDGSWYNGGKEGSQKTADVKAEALKKLTDLGEEALVAYPEEWSTAYKQEVGCIIDMVHDVFFPSQEEISKKDRQVFNEWTKAFLVLEFMIRNDMDILSIVCRDGMDRAGMLIALVTLLIKIMQGEISIENSQKTVQALYEIIERLCSTTFLTAEQAIEDGSGRRTRLLNCWKKLGLSQEHWGIRDRSVIDRLVSHRTFSRLKQRLKVA